MTNLTANAVTHLDIAGPDLAQLSDFYSTVLDWRVSPKGPGYALVETPGSGPDAAIVESASASITVGIVVPDLAASIARAVECGGTEVMPPVDNGWVTKAQVRDPAGNLLTLIQQ